MMRSDLLQLIRKLIILLPFTTTKKMLIPDNIYMSRYGQLFSACGSVTFCRLKIIYFLVIIKNRWETENL